MRTQFSERMDIKENLINLIGEEINNISFNSNKINYFIRFEKPFKGINRPISFYRVMFIKNDMNVNFEIVKVNSIHLDDKYYYCGFKSLKEVDYYGHINDKILKEYAWVENNKKILYMDLKAFIVIYNKLAKIKSKKCNLLNRILLNIVDGL